MFKFLRQVGALTAVVLLAAACGEAPKEVVVGTDPGVIVEDRQKPEVPLPLSAVDFAGWTAGKHDGQPIVFNPCDAEAFTGWGLDGEFRAEVLLTPTGAQVVSQITDLEAVEDISETVLDAVVSCPFYEDSDGNEVMVRVIDEVINGRRVVGAERTITDKNTGNKTVEVYGLVYYGDHVSEVLITAEVGPDGTRDLEKLALDLLAAADAKNEGQDLPQVTVPNLPKPQPAPSGGTSGNSGSGGGGGKSPDQGGSGPDEGEPNVDGDADWYDAPTQPHAPDYGLGSNPDLAGAEGGSGTTTHFDPDSVGQNNIVENDGE